MTIDAERIWNDFLDRKISIRIQNIADEEGMSVLSFMQKNNVKWSSGRAATSPSESVLRRSSKTFLEINRKQPQRLVCGEQTIDKYIEASDFLNAMYQVDDPVDEYEFEAVLSLRGGGI